jgi:hypothetical protein
MVPRSDVDDHGILMQESADLFAVIERKRGRDDLDADRIIEFAQQPL